MLGITHSNTWSVECGVLSIRHKSVSGPRHMTDTQHFTLNTMYLNGEILSVECES